MNVRVHPTLARARPGRHGIPRPPGGRPCVRGGGRRWHVQRLWSRSRKLRRACARAVRGRRTSARPRAGQVRRHVVTRGPPCVRALAATRYAPRLTRSRLSFTSAASARLNDNGPCFPALPSTWILGAGEPFLGARRRPCGWRPLPRCKGPPPGRSGLHRWMRPRWHLLTAGPLLRLRDCCPCRATQPLRRACWRALGHITSHHARRDLPSRITPAWTQRVCGLGRTYRSCERIPGAPSAPLWTSLRIQGALLRPPTPSSATSVRVRLSVLTRLSRIPGRKLLKRAGILTRGTSRGSSSSTS